MENLKETIFVPHISENRGIDYFIIFVCSTVAFLTFGVLILDYSFIREEKPHVTVVQVAKVAKLEGIVRTRSGSTPVWESVEKDQGLGAFDLVYTDDEASVKLDLLESGDLSLAEKTLVSLDGSEDHPIITVVQGSIEVKAQNVGLKVNINGKKIDVQPGAEARIKRLSEKESQITVVKGSVNYNHSIIQQNQKAQVDSSGEIVSLKLQKVYLESPKDGEKFVVDRDKKEFETHFLIKIMDEDSKHHLEISSSADFQSILRTQLITSNIAKTSLSSGIYFWRIKTVSENRSIFSETRKLEINRITNNPGEKSILKSPKVPKTIHLKLPEQGAKLQNIFLRSPILAILAHVIESATAKGSQQAQVPKEWELSWEPVDGARQYVVEIYSDLQQKRLVKRESVVGTILSLRELKPGSYYLRLAAVDEGGILGNFSEPSLLVITRQEKKKPQKVTRHKSAGATNEALIKPLSAKVSVSPQNSVIKKEEKNVLEKREQTSTKLHKELSEESNLIQVALAYSPGLYTYHRSGLRLSALYFNSWEFFMSYEDKIEEEKNLGNSLSQHRNFRYSIRFRRLKTSFFEGGVEETAQSQLNLLLLDLDGQVLWFPKWAQTDRIRGSIGLGAEEKTLEIFSALDGSAVSIETHRKVVGKLLLGVEWPLGSTSAFLFEGSYGQGNNTKTEKLWLLNQRADVFWNFMKLRRASLVLGAGISQERKVNSFSSEEEGGQQESTAMKRSLNTSIAYKF